MPLDTYSRHFKDSIYVVTETHIFYILKSWFIQYVFWDLFKLANILLYN